MTVTGGGAAFLHPGWHVQSAQASRGALSSFRPFLSVTCLGYRHFNSRTDPVPLLDDARALPWRSLKHAEAARSLSVSEPAARRYLDLLSGLFMVRQLQPWHVNLNKRQVKSPKVYLRDSGLLHALLGLSTGQEILSHPKVGASWEGYAIEEETIQMVQPEAAYFWATHTGAELDLLLIKRGRRYGVEVQVPRRASADIVNANRALGPRTGTSHGALSGRSTLFAGPAGHGGILWPTSRECPR